MQKRGGGILDIELRDKTTQLENYYQLHATFETKHCGIFQYLPHADVVFICC